MTGLAERIVAEARSWLGTPYRHQGGTRGVACDCAGLVAGVWRAVYGRELDRPRHYSADWAETGGGEIMLDCVRSQFLEKPRDHRGAALLLTFRWRPDVAAKHCAIMIDETRFIHAYEGSRVCVSALVPQWRRRIAGVFAFPETLS